MSEEKMKNNTAIENYGVIGNLETVALIALDGSIDFMCYPHFDSPPVFDRLLNMENGSVFKIAPVNGEMKTKQMYLPDTNILITRFMSSKGILEIIDFMPLWEDYTGHELVRIVKSVQGDIDIHMDCKVSFDYGRKKTTVESIDDYEVRFDAEEQLGSRLITQTPLEINEHTASSRFNLKEGEQVVFSFQCDTQKCGRDTVVEHANDALEKTKLYWRNWLNKCKYDGLWRETIQRSALMLKLLISKQHGSMVAAPTFSLPEALGGERNWDYRYCWIRDSSFTIFSLLKLGFQEEADHFIQWITKCYEASEEDGKLKVLYRLDGDCVPEEELLHHYQGYTAKGSKPSTPVRIGNEAKDQRQMDIYGELIDSIYLANRAKTIITYEGWNNLTHTIEYVCENWNKTDCGIWEFRGKPQHHTHSRLMCWVAIDRAIRLSEQGAFPAPISRWREVRDKIYQDIHENCWNEDRQAFTQAIGSDDMDAAILVMPIVKFISFEDPRWRSTMEAIKKELVTDVFVRRYSDSLENEGLDKSIEGSFTMCTFWYCENLARMNQVDEASLLFEKMLGYTNHLGLFSEEIGFEGQHLGNFPQAFTHLALISAAIAINDAKGKRRHQIYYN